jgi:hypothetical protein
MFGDKDEKVAIEGLVPVLGSGNIFNGALGLVLAGVTSISGAIAQDWQTIWNFDNLESIGGQNFRARPDGLFVQGS